MEAKQEVIPLMMVQVLHMIFPRFAEKDDQGGFAQQDANECWVELTRMLQQKLRTEGQTSSVVDAYMGGRFATEMKCLEAPEEAVVKSTEEFLSLSCFLSQEVKYLHSGLKGRLSEEIEKHSPSLDRNAKYEKSSKVDRLPGYLTIQMIRFFFKVSRHSLGTVVVVNWVCVEPNFLPVVGNRRWTLSAKVPLRTEIGSQLLES